MEEVNQQLAIIAASGPKTKNADGTPLSPQQLSKEEGNFHYKEGRYDKAIESYTKAIKLTKNEDEKATFLSNRAACYAQMQMYNEVIADCNLCLEVQPNNVKAIVRRGLAYESKEIWKLARIDMQKAISLDPTARQASDGIVRIDRILRQQEKLNLK